MPWFSSSADTRRPITSVLILIAIVATMAGCSSDDSSPTDPGGGGTLPTANFSATPTTGEAGSGTSLAVQFIDTSTAGSAPITAWSWNFGDGGTSNAQNPLHTYLNAGSYNVTLSVTNSVGNASETKTNYVVATEPVDQSTLIPGRVSVALVPAGVEFFDVRATDSDGNQATISVLSSNPGVVAVSMATATRARVTGGGYGTATLTFTAGTKSVEVAVEVYNPMEMETDGLILSFVDDFDWKWNDGGSGGGRSGGYWHPKTTNGFFALGSIGLPNYSNPDQAVAVMVAKNAPGSTALARPESYVRVWADSGSGADNDGSFWRPVPPSGYVAMGLVAQAGYATPSLDAVRCVRADLTTPGRAGAIVWNDSGTGADADFGSWNIEIPVGAAPSSVAHIAPGCFVGHNSWTAPSSHLVMHVLKIHFKELSAGNPQAYTPDLTSLAQPPAISEQMLGKSILVPFTAIDDALYAGTVHWQVTNSPFYRMDRSAFFQLLFHNENKTSLVQENSETYTSGVSTTESDTYHITTGIKVTAEGGVSFLGTGGKVSVEVSVEMGYATTQEKSVLAERSTTKTVFTQPGKAAALWQKSSSFALYRHNGSIPQVVGAAWTVGEDSYVTDEYPN